MMFSMNNVDDMPVNPALPSSVTRRVPLTTAGANPVAVIAPAGGTIMNPRETGETIPDAFN